MQKVQSRKIYWGRRNKFTKPTKNWDCEESVSSVADRKGNSRAP